MGEGPVVLHGSDPRSGDTVTAPPPCERNRAHPRNPRKKAHAAA